MCMTAITKVKRDLLQMWHVNLEGVGGGLQWQRAQTALLRWHVCRFNAFWVILITYSLSLHFFLWGKKNKMMMLFIVRAVALVK